MSQLWKLKNWLNQRIQKIDFPKYVDKPTHDSLTGYKTYSTVFQNFSRTFLVVIFQFPIAKNSQIDFQTSGNT